MKKNPNLTFLPSYVFPYGGAKVGKSDEKEKGFKERIYESQVSDESKSPKVRKSESPKDSKSKEAKST